MPDDVQKNDSAGRQISDRDRFRYIGFEVFPGKPKDLFKTEEEKQKLIEARRQKKEKGEIVREECILFEERVSAFDRIMLAIASLVMVAALFVPWFSAYNEIEETVKTPAVTTTADSLTASGATAPPDSLAMVAGDSAAMATPGAAAAVAGTTATAGAPALAAETTATSGAPAAVAGSTATAAAQTPSAAAAPTGPASNVATEKVSESEEIIHGYVAQKRYHKEYARVSGIGAFGDLGRLGPVLFGSGISLLLTTVLVIIYILLCLALPLLTLYGLFVAKGDPDQRALRLKRILRLNWLPLILFGAILVLSFFGGTYSRPLADTYSSLGDSYNVGVFLDTLSFGIIVTLAASILVAAKGSEI